MNYTDHDLGEQRFMAMDHYIDLVLFQYTQIDLTINRNRVPKEDVLEFRRDHRTSPSICKSCSGSCSQEALIILIYSHMGSVHQLYDLPIDPPGGNS